jgi:WD40 repeat protein
MLWRMAVSPDGKLLAVSDPAAKCVRLYDVASMSLRSYVQCKDVPYYLCFSADGSQLVTAHDDCAKLWNVADRSHVRDFTGHTSFVNVPCFSPDTTLLVTPSADKTVRLWNVSSGATVHTLTGHTAIVWAVAFAAQGRQLLSISHDKTLRVWDVASGKQLRVFQLPTAGYTLCLSADGESVFVGSADGALQQWRLSDGQLLRKF